MATSATTVAMGTSTAAGCALVHARGFFRDSRFSDFQLEIACSAATTAATAEAAPRSVSVVADAGPRTSPDEQQAPEQQAPEQQGRGCSNKGRGLGAECRDGCGADTAAAGPVAAATGEGCSSDAPAESRSAPTAVMTVLASFPAHGIILSLSSTWFEARTRPSELGADCPKVLRMEVDGRRQLAAAEAVVESAYLLGRLSDAALGDQALLVQTLVVADRYGFAGALGAAAGALAALVPPEASAASAAAAAASSTAPAPGGGGSSACSSSMEWETVDSLLRLPDSVRLQAAVEPAVVAALRRVLCAFSDLEVAWQDPALREVWVGLPAAAVEHVLGHAGTKVACENTALYALACWVESQQAQREVPASELDGVCRHIRLQHLSPAYAAVVAPELPWFWDYLTRSGTLRTWLYINRASACGRTAAVVKTTSAALAAPPRPKSSLRHVGIKVDIPAAAIEKALADTGTGTDDSASVDDVPPHGMFFSGYFWSVDLVAEVTEAVGGVRTLGLYLAHQLKPPAGWADAEGTAVVTPYVDCHADDALGVERAGETYAAGSNLKIGTVSRKLDNSNVSFCYACGERNFFKAAHGNLDAWKAHVIHAAPDGRRVLTVESTVMGVVCAPAP